MFRLFLNPVGAVASGWVLAMPMAALGQSPYSQTPNSQQFFRYYPERAMNLGKEGKAVIGCDVNEGGSVGNCVVISENPAGFEFGAAALKLAPLFKMKPKTVDGKPVAGAHVTIPIAFRLQENLTGGQGVMTTRVQWASQPSASDMENTRPPALSKGGTASVRCSVIAGLGAPREDLGKLVDCKSIKEVPTNAGLDRAVQSLTPLFRLDSKAVAAAYSDTSVQFDLIWLPRSPGTKVQTLPPRAIPSTQ